MTRRGATNQPGRLRGQAVISDRLECRAFSGSPMHQVGLANHSQGTAEPYPTVDRISTT